MKRPLDSNCLNVFAPSSTDRRRSMTKERHVRPDRAGESIELFARRFQSPEPIESNQGARGVARPSTKARLGGNGLVEHDRRAPSAARGRFQPLGSLHHEVVGTDRQRRLVARECDRARRQVGNSQRIVEVNGNHQRLDLVVAVRSTAEDFQKKIQLRRGKNFDAFGEVTNNHQGSSQIALGGPGREGNPWSCRRLGNMLPRPEFRPRYMPIRGSSRGRRNTWVSNGGVLSPSLNPRKPKNR